VVGALERVTLVDDTIRVPPGGARAIDVLLKQQPGTVVCTYSVLSGGSGVRVALLNKRNQVLAGTSFDRNGGFRHRVRDRGEYEIVVDNGMEGRGVAEVRLMVSLVFGETAPEARELPPRKRYAIVALSLIGFAAMAMWSGRRLLRAIREQKSPGQPPPSP